MQSDEPRNFTRLFHPGFGLEHVEQITGKWKDAIRLKMLKRQMYGRAGIELLRARLLPEPALMDP
jgi:hypothetical protein